MQEDVQRHVNSATYGRGQKRRNERVGASNRTGKWSTAETDLFYEGLSQFGTDFELIAGMFSYRDRRQVKKKWDREEKKCPERIDEALKVKKKPNIQFYEEVIGWDLSNGPIPADPMHKYYEGLPTLQEKVKLESNRAPSHEPELLARKKEESSRPLGEDGEGQEGQEGEEGEAQVENPEAGDRPLFNPDRDEEQAVEDAETGHDTADAAEDDQAEVVEEAAMDEQEEEAEPEVEAEPEPDAGAFDFSQLGGIAIKSTA